jgi:hypothetical protein
MKVNIKLNFKFHVQIFYKYLGIVCGGLKLFNNRLCVRTE